MLFTPPVCLIARFGPPFATLFFKPRNPPPKNNPGPRVGRWASLPAHGCVVIGNHFMLIGGGYKKGLFIAIGKHLHFQAIFSPLLRSARSGRGEEGQFATTKKNIKRGPSPPPLPEDGLGCCRPGVGGSPPRPPCPSTPPCSRVSPPLSPRHPCRLRANLLQIANLRFANLRIANREFANSRIANRKSRICESLFSELLKNVTPDNLSLSFSKYRIVFQVQYFNSINKINGVFCKKLHKKREMYHYSVLLLFLTSNDPKHR